MIWAGTDIVVAALRLAAGRVKSALAVGYTALPALAREGKSYAVWRQYGGEIGVDLALFSALAFRL